MSDVMPSLTNMFLSIFDWFEKIYAHYGVWSILLGAFLIYTIYRLLLKPIVGGSGSSDTARKNVPQSKVED